MNLKARPSAVPCCVLCLIALFALLLASCGGGSSQSNVKPGGGTTPPIAVPSQPAPTFFGMHQSHLVGCDPAPLDFTLFDIPAGAFRVWSTCKTQWADMNRAQGSYDFTGLDNILNALSIKGINDAFINLGSTPNWISSNPTDILCDRANINGEPPGMCDPPSDLNADGSGTDLAWRNFVTALLQHVTAAGYSSSHAHLQIYSIWDEFHRSDSVGTATCVQQGSGSGLPCSYRGTFPQMLRMTQDLRCIVEGHASDPITGLNLTCGTVNYTAIGLDPKAQVMHGDAGGSPLDNGNATMQNYLYCNSNPPPQSMCNWSASNPLGANATDIISGHSYFNEVGSVPEDLMSSISGEMGMLAPAEAAKPYITGEGSWGKNATPGGAPTVSDPGLQAAFVTRWYLDLLILGVQRGYWFAWDEATAQGTGALWSPSSVAFPPLECTTPDPNIGGFYCTGAIAYMQTVDWLSGATASTVTCPSSCTSPAPGVFTLNLTRSGGYQAQVIWDSSKTTSCNNAQCGSTAFAASPFTVAQWRDVAGNTHSGPPTAVGASPIIVENMTPP